ncbi:MAG: hypothetical protein QXW62_06575 [Candidatus Methanomethylicaceae archaeon]
MIKNIYEEQNEAEKKIVSNIKEAEVLLAELKKYGKKEEMIDVSNLEAKNIEYVISMLKSNNYECDVVRYLNYVFLMIKRI